MEFKKILAYDLIGTPSIAPGGYVEPSNFASMVSSALSFILILSTVIATIFVILGGVQMATSGGDSGKLKTAQASVQWAIVGLVVSIAGYAIVQMVATLLGIDSLDLPDL